MLTRKPSLSPDPQDLLDLDELEADGLGAFDEPKQFHGFGRVETIPVLGARGARDQPMSLVQPNGLAAYARLRADSSNRQAFLAHSASLRPSPWGNVKR